MKKKKRPSPLAATRRAIEICGGVVAAGEVVDRSKQQVWQWKAGVKRPPIKCAIQLANESRGEIRAADIRPELAELDTGR